MPSDYRYDPFSDTSTAISITNELHVIPTASPFTIRLSEVPDKTAALTMKVRDSLSAAITAADATSITVANGAWFASGNIITVDSEQILVGGIAGNTLTVTRGYNSTVATTHTSGTEVFIEESMTKVLASPSSGQFWPDYSTGADNDTNWNTGTILFNAADAGKTVVAAYNGMGALASADYRGHQLFTASGTFTVPKGVTTVYVSGCGGGGGGGGGVYAEDVAQGAPGGGGACALKTPLAVVPGKSYAITIGNGGSVGVGSSAYASATNGGTGGASSFGSLLSLPGGGGGQKGVSTSQLIGGVAGGFGASRGGWSYASDYFAHAGSTLFCPTLEVVGGYGNNTVGTAGLLYGGGGTGGTGVANGGVGAKGMILIEW